MKRNTEPEPVLCIGHQRKQLEREKRARWFVAVVIAMVATIIYFIITH